MVKEAGGKQPAGSVEGLLSEPPGMDPGGYLMVVIRRNTVDLIVSGAADIRADIGNFDVLVVYMNRKPSL